jgi:predicted permease
MVDVALSLVPVFTLIALGALLRRAELLKLEQWIGIERLTYYVLFPPLMFTSIVGGAFAGAEALLLAIGLTASVALMTGLMLLLRPVLPMTGSQFSSVFQSGLRWNGYVALGVISSLHGPQGLALSAVGFAALAPINDALSLLVSNRFAGAKPQPNWKLVLRLLANPLIIAAALACGAVALGLRPTAPVERTLHLLGDATVSLGLICVGASLDVRHIESKAAHLPLALGAVLRLWVMPAIAATLCVFLGLSGMALQVGVICAAAPAATMAYALSRTSGADSELMSNLITITTVLSVLTLPASILIVQALLR